MYTIIVASNNQSIFLYLFNFDVCYLNLQLSLDLVFGFGGDLSRTLWNALETNLKSLGGMIGNCLAPPNEEYVFPRDLYRY